MVNKLELGDRTVKESHRDKLFFPGVGLTKGDVLDYYLRISEYILPYLKDRPVTMHRFPNGIDDKSFYQKQAPDYFPNWIDKTTVENRDGGITDYVICNDRETLLYLVNQSSIVHHTWLSRRRNLELPDRMIFDLDPSGNDFSSVVEAALKLKTILTDEMNLSCHVMTTGSRGLHVLVPLGNDVSFGKARAFARFVADILVDRNKNLFTTEVRKDKRDGKLYIDTARNAYGQTAIVPYSLRALKNAPVATPLDWDELNDSGLSPRTYHVKNIFRRLGQKDDPWKNMRREGVSLKTLEKNMDRFNT